MKKRTGRRKLSTHVVTTPKRLGVRDDAAYDTHISLYGPAQERTQPTHKRKKNIMNEKSDSAANKRKFPWYYTKPVYSKRFYALVFALIGIIITAIACAGCATIRDAYPNLATATEQLVAWLEANPDTVQALFDKAKKELETETPADPSAPESPAEDEADFATFNWTYGGFNGAGAAFDSRVQMASCVVSANRMTYTWADPKGFAYWGESNPHDASRALVCAFVKDAAGNWVGGKYDWISTDRSWRGFEHLYSYNGWNMDGIPNPTMMATVFVSPDKARRSNVKVCEWRR